MKRYEQGEAEALLRSTSLDSGQKQALASQLDNPGALSRAVRDGYVAVATLLLENGATPIYVNLEEAIERDRVEILRLLLRYISPLAIADSLPDLLSKSSVETRQLVLNDERIIAELRTYILFYITLKTEHLSPAQSILWLTEKDVIEAQRAAYTALRRYKQAELSEEKGEARSGRAERSVYEIAYFEYFSHHLGLDTVVSELGEKLIHCSLG